MLSIQSKIFLGCVIAEIALVGALSQALHISKLNKEEPNRSQVHHNVSGAFRYFSTHDAGEKLKTIESRNTSLSNGVYKYANKSHVEVPLKNTLPDYISTVSSYGVKEKPNIRAHNFFIFSYITILLLIVTTYSIASTVFNYRFTRHINTIAKVVCSPGWFSGDEEIALARKPPNKADNLHNIVSALEIARLTNQQAIKQMQLEIEFRQKANEKLVEVNREQSEFTYAVSHDLKSPTNTLEMLLTELAHSEESQFSDFDKEIVSHARNTVGRMKALVDDVLVYSTAVETIIRKEPVNLNAVVCQVLEDLKLEISSCEAVIYLGNLPEIVGDIVQLRRLFQNLISNSLKFRRGGVIPEIEISSFGESNGKVKILIVDNGIGIDPEYSEKIFSMFHRLHTHDQFSGSGLGLTICARIAANHNGVITLLPGYSQGSTFQVLLEK